MEKFYIQYDHINIYSVYHEPKFSENNSKGVILCYPIGHEYIRCHRFYVQLAKKITERGFHVIRFDYPFSGDSFSIENENTNKFTIDNCLKSIKAVCSEIIETCDLTDIYIGGCRLGGTLAYLYSINEQVAGTFLLNPIIDGNIYINEIKREYKEWLHGSFTFEKDKKENSLNIFGFEYNQMLLNELSSLNILQQILPKNSVLYIDKHNSFRATSDNITFRESVNQSFWIKAEDDRSKNLVPIDELNFIVDWL